MLFGILNHNYQSGNQVETWYAWPSKKNITIKYYNIKKKVNQCLPSKIPKKEIIIVVVAHDFHQACGFQNSGGQSLW